MAFGIAQSRLVITANGTDFTRIVLAIPDHPGLGLIRDQNTRDRQISETLALVGALLTHRRSGGTIRGHIFTWRSTTARLAARRIP